MSFLENGFVPEQKLLLRGGGRPGNRTVPGFDGRRRNVHALLKTFYYITCHSSRKDKTAINRDNLISKTESVNDKWPGLSSQPHECITAFKRLTLL